MVSINWTLPSTRYNRYTPCLSNYWRYYFHRHSQNHRRGGLPQPGEELKELWAPHTAHCPAHTRRPSEKKWTQFNLVLIFGDVMSMSLEWGKLSDNFYKMFFSGFQIETCQKIMVTSMYLTLTLFLYLTKSLKYFLKKSDFLFWLLLLLNMLGDFQIHTVNFKTPYICWTKNL